jgi:hypothetical protein
VVTVKSDGVIRLYSNCLTASSKRLKDEVAPIVNASNIMDVGHFLKVRTNFIRKFYDEAVKVFHETQRAIEAGEQPFVPPFSEDGDLPFEAEWSDAETSIQIVGRAAISMLSESLKVYFIEWDKLLGINCSKQLKAEFKKGYWKGYRECFARACGIDWRQCPADAELIEQIALARNTSQHGGRITSISAQHPEDLRKKFPNPVFVHEYEKNLDEEDVRALSWLGSDLIISRDALFETIRQVELLVDWLEPQMQKIRWGH